MDFPLPTLQPPTSWPLPALVNVGASRRPDSCGQAHARPHRIEALLPVRIASFQPIATAPKIEVPSTLPPSGSSVGTHLDQRCGLSVHVLPHRKQARKKKRLTMTCHWIFCNLGIHKEYLADIFIFIRKSEYRNAPATCDLFDRLMIITTHSTLFLYRPSTARRNFRSG